MRKVLEVFECSLNGGLQQLLGICDSALVGERSLEIEAQCDYPLIVFRFGDLVMAAVGPFLIFFQLAADKEIIELWCRLPRETLNKSTNRTARSLSR